MPVLDWLVWWCDGLNGEEFSFGTDRCVVGDFAQTWAKFVAVSGMGGL